MWYVVAIWDVINEIKENEKNCYNAKKWWMKNCQSLCKILLWFNSDADFLPKLHRGCSV